jgi:predicted acetyltransferase
MSDSDFGFPRDLGDGLVLRWGTPADAEELGVFNVRLHSDDLEEPEEFLANWTHNLMGGGHPTTGAGDFTVVVDEKNGSKIVSSMNLISQTWTYDGIPFGFGRPELVATDDNYRRRGLVRAQFEAIHARSAAKGELVQGITGIPWYYRQFGYEMALELGGGRSFFWGRSGNDKRVDEEPYRLRPATPEDLPLLEELYAVHCAGSLLTRWRDAAQWRYELFEADRESPYARHVYVVETDAATAAGYVEYRLWKHFFIVRELGVLPGHSLRAVGLYLTRALKIQADELNQTREKPIDHISFNLGVAHPLYKALERELEQQRKPYAWYIRVPNLPAFLRHIAPALARRLAASVMPGYSGALKLNFYLAQLKVDFKDGKLVDAGPYMPEHFFDADAFFPDLTFLQLLFGYRTLDELNYARVDCYANNADAAVLLNALFPKQHSWVVELG